MARKRRAEASQGQPAARLRDTRLAPLKHVKRTLRRNTPPAPPPDAAPPPPSDDDATLFRQQLADAHALRDANRAQLDTPRPSPTPRRQAIDNDPPTPSPAATGGPAQDDFGHLMDDVTPLPAANRADLDATRPPPDGPAPDAAQLRDPDDVLAWLGAGATALKPANRAEVATPPPVAAPRQHEADERAALHASLEPFTLEDRLDIGEEATFLRPGLPRRVLADLRRGRWVVQAEIDLHGLVRDEARAALGEFMALALRRGQRCVRVVHGKGLRSPGKVGVLKHLSRGWLAQREEILAFCQARPNEGGSGALRVLLRAPARPRN